MSKHASHFLDECPNVDLCQQLPVDKFTRARSGTSHAGLTSPTGVGHPVGRVIVLPPVWDKFNDELMPAELVRKNANQEWEEIA